VKKKTGELREKHQQKSFCLCLYQSTSESTFHKHSRTNTPFIVILHN